MEPASGGWSVLNELLNEHTRLHAAFPSRERKRPVVNPRDGAWGAD
jgi:hypothetical protein